MSNHDPELQRVRVVDRGKINQDYASLLYAEISNIQRGSDPKKENYSLRRLDLEGHLCFDLLLDRQGRIVTFCGIYSGGRYPQGVYRVLNRVYVAPQYRAMQFKAYATQHLLPRQVEEYRNELKLIFVSREKPSAKSFLNKWNTKWAPGNNWIVPQQMIRVAAGWDKSCFQAIAYKQLQKCQWHPEAITEEIWNMKTDFQSAATKLPLEIF